MNRTNAILGGLAGVQLALVTVTWWPSSPDVHQARSLVVLPGEVDRIVVHGRKKPGDTDAPAAVELRRRNGAWVVASAHDYPADAGKVTEVLDHLEALEVAAPVATQASSHASLNLADVDHARTVELHAGEATVSLVLGAASGTAVNVRLAGEDPAWTVRGWTAFSIGDQPESYWRTDAVSLDPDAVDSVTVTRPDGGFTLERSQSGWTAAGDETLLDAAGIDALLQRLANLKISAVLGTEVPPELEGGTRVEWTAKAGEGTVEGALVFGPSAADRSVARADGSRWTVEVPDGTIARWRTVTLEDLAPKESPGPAGPAGSKPTNHP